MSDPLWRHVFGNDNPVEIEIGPGRGDVLLAFAAADPATNFFGIEHRRAQAAAITARAAALGVGNVRVVAGDARCIVRHLVPPASVTAYHVYFPDPWPKTRHRARRLFQPSFVAALANSLVPGGAVHLATDVPQVFTDASRALAAAGFQPVDIPSPRERPRTHFERKYAAAGTLARSFRFAQAAAGSPRPQNAS